MAFLYLLTEDDSDDLFFERCLEQLTNLSFQRLQPRLRRGSGINKVRRNLRTMLQKISYAGLVKDTYFVVAIDNDRSPEHPDHRRLPGLSPSEMSKGCRFCDFIRVVEDVFGNNRNSWPVQGAIAVPVQMLESWLLLILNPDTDEDTLPFFANQDQSIAHQYHSPQPVSQQLKDLCAIEKQKLNIRSNEELCLHCADIMDVESLANKSRSFALFKEQVDQWVIDS